MESALDLRSGSAEATGQELNERWEQRVLRNRVQNKRIGGGHPWVG